ncbi:MAG: hypothetical protein AAGI23_02145 [Bacteroidota bacterium]
MRQFLFLFLILTSCQAYSQDEAWTDKTRVLPDALRKVPEAIFIRHTPNPNYPEPTTPEDDTKYAYVWRHATSMTSPDLELTVKFAGSYIWYSEAGWQKNVYYNKKQFAKKFNCPKGILEKGVTYTFEKNYRWGDQPYGGDALWYVIAEDQDGNLYRGISILETEAEIQEK